MSGALAAIVGGGAPGVLNAALAGGGGAGSATWQLLNDGTFSITTTGTGDWVTPALAGIAAFYEVKVDVNSGTFSTGTVGSYEALSSTRTWTRTGPGTVDFNVTFREIATGNVRLIRNGLTLVVA